MPHFRIETQRHPDIWTERAAGELSATITRDGLIAEMRKLAVQYPHRLVIDGEVVAQAEPPVRQRRTQRQPA